MKTTIAIAAMLFSVTAANAQSTCGDLPKLTDDDQRAMMAITRVFEDRYLIKPVPGFISIMASNRDCFSIHRKDRFAEFHARIYKIDGSDCTYLMEYPDRTVGRINFNKLTTRIFTPSSGGIRVQGAPGAVCDGDGTCIANYAGYGGGNRLYLTAKAFDYIFTNMCEPARLTPEQEFN